MDRKLIMLAVGMVAINAILAVLAVLVVPLLLGVPNPPVDVYARPTPLTSERAGDLLPLEVAGFFLLGIRGEPFADGGEIAIGDYDGGIKIEIVRLPSLNDAAFTIDDGISFWEDIGAVTSVNASEQHWFTAFGNGTTVFAWHKGVWVFVVFAPNAALRNQVAEELPF